MFDIVAWHEIAHLSEWSGLSIGMLVALGFLVYLNPTFLRLAIEIGLAVALCFGCLIYGETTGAADKQKQWDAAKIESAKEAKARDDEIGKSLAQEYEPVIAELQKRADDSDQRVADYEKNLLPKLANAGACELGADAVRLRSH